MQKAIAAPALAASAPLSCQRARADRMAARAYSSRRPEKHLNKTNLKEFLQPSSHPWADASGGIKNGPCSVKIQAATGIRRAKPSISKGAVGASVADPVGARADLTSHRPEDRGMNQGVGKKGALLPCEKKFLPFL